MSDDCEYIDEDNGKNDWVRDNRKSLVAEFIEDNLDAWNRFVTQEWETRKYRERN